MKMKKFIGGIKVFCLISLLTISSAQRIYAESSFLTSSNKSYELTQKIAAVELSDASDLKKHESLSFAASIYGGGGGAIVGAILGLGVTKGFLIGWGGSLAGGLALYTGVVVSAKITVSIVESYSNEEDVLIDEANQQKMSSVEEIQLEFAMRLEQLKNEIQSYLTSGQLTEELEHFLDEMSLTEHPFTNEDEIMYAVLALDLERIHFEVKSF